MPVIMASAAIACALFLRLALCSLALRISRLQALGLNFLRQHFGGGCHVGGFDSEIRVSAIGRVTRSTASISVP